MEERELARELSSTLSSLPGSTATALPASAATGSSRANCASVSLPHGVIFLANGTRLDLGLGATFKPTCSSHTPAIVAGAMTGNVISVDQTVDDGSAVTTDTPSSTSDFRDPFYESTFPQCYALAATTVVAYTLVIMLFITPRSFLDGGIVVLGRRGFTNGGSGINIGGRPWLQKVAALTVAISLTIATADTFRVAEAQYDNGIENAVLLQSEVLGGTELKVIRIISDTFLWLAQAQTLIRLFPRHREKVIIKWTAFALITLDVIFQSLNSFQYTGAGQTRPRSFTDAVPALSYLFELSLGVLYAAWVIYYALMKKRYAFYHKQMKNMILVAVLSVVAILVPVVFFILDVSKPDLAGWGDYVRWVGAAAASVIVWEWVERIEALEREEKKDGILGREVFDGDEMLEMTNSDYTWPRRRKRKDNDEDDTESQAGGNQEQTTTTSERRIWPSASSIVSRYRSRSRPREGDASDGPQNTESTNNNRTRGLFLQPPLWPARPAPAITPVSRTDSASAASTVYAVRYQPWTETASRTTPTPNPAPTSLSRSNSVTSSQHGDELGIEPTQVSAQALAPAPTPGPEPSQSAKSTRGESTSTSGRRWRALAQGIPIPRLATPRLARGDSKDPIHEEGNRWDIRARFEEFAATQAEKFRERVKPTVDTENLPVIVRPAPPRPGAALARLREEEEEAEQSATALDRSLSNGSESSPPVGDELLPSTVQLYPTTSGTSASSASRPRPSSTSTTSNQAPNGGIRRQGSGSAPVLHVFPAPPRRDHDPRLSQVAMGKQPAEDARS